MAVLVAAPLEVLAWGAVDQVVAPLELQAWGVGVTVCVVWVGCLWEAPLEEAYSLGGWH